METLRIAMVSDWFLPRVGGVEVSISELSRALARRGHEVFVVTHRNLARRNAKGLERAEDGYYVYWVPTAILARDDVTVDPLTVARAAMFVKRNAFDVVHAHGISSTLSLIGAMVLSGGTGVPSLLTSHSLLKDSVGGLSRRLLRYGLSWPSMLSGVSRAAAEDIAELSGRPAVVTHNCIDIARWREGADSLGLDGDPVIVTVSRLSPRKAPEDIVTLAKILKSERPKAKIYLVGDGVMSRALRDLASREDVSDTIVLLGSRPRGEVASIMASADAFVLTSRAESFGLAVLESMSLGVPPVVYRSPGVLDLVDDGVNGFLVDDVYSMAATLLRLTDDGSLRKSVGSAATEKASLFDCSVVINRYLQVYKELMDICHEIDKRFMAYRAYRLIVGDPVRPGEWCDRKKWEYHERAREGIVPVVRRGAGRPALP